MRRFNEPVTDMTVDTNVTVNGIGRPVRWRWRTRWYSGGPVHDHWVEVSHRWWLDAADIDEVRIEHWVVEAQSSWGTGLAELTRDESSGRWQLVAIRANDRPPPAAAPEKRIVPTGYDQRVYVELPEGWGPSQQVIGIVSAAGYAVDKLVGSDGSLLIFRNDLG